MLLLQEAKIKKQISVLILTLLILHLLQYNAASAYIDTFMHFTVNTPVAPEINKEIREHNRKCSQRYG